MLNLDSCPIPNPNVIGQMVEGEAVLVLPEKGKVKVLNPVGARVWSLADGHRNIRSIASLICAEFLVEPKQAEADVLAFITELVDKDIFYLPLETGK
jgi:hypothetical protein